MLVPPLLLCGLLAPGVTPWPNTAPEALPPVTVRWDDPDLAERFVVSGARYECRVGTQPARLVSLTIDGREVLPDGAEPTCTDAAGEVYRPAPPELTPDWQVWRRAWVPASSSRARMNVWNASPYYWDAHLLDIPFVSDRQLAALREAQAGPPLAEFKFGVDAQGWEALHSCTVTPGGGALQIHLTGDDPYLQSPPVELPAAVVVEFRLRSSHGGGAAVYWATTAAGYGGEQVHTFGVSGDETWHDYRVQINAAAPLRRLRFDPPGEVGEVQLERVTVRAAAAVPPVVPRRGELVLHATPDQLRLELKVEAADGQAEIRTVRWLGAPAPPTTRLVGRRPLAESPGLAVLGVPGAEFKEGWSAPLSGQPARAWWVVQPLAAGQSAEEALLNDLQPLPASAAKATGGHWLGYDEVTGLYRIGVDSRESAYSFEPTYKVPNRRLETDLTLTNEAQPRRLLCRAETNIGNLEAAVLTDPYGFPVPTPAFVAKNFAGEREEPDDSAYGDAYFPLDLGAGELRAFRVVLANQNWGDHPLKQVSSIRFFNIYWHLSTGASETTCYTHNLLRLNSAWVRIPDFRPYSGEFWPGQPQHDCRQWPGFLDYNGNAGRPVYERTEFASISPNLARFTMFFHTADEAAKARLEVLEIPQRDELREFVKLRYDFVKPVTIEGDARDVFRWCNVNEKQRPASLLWTDADEQWQTRDTEPSAEPMLLGVPLPATNAVVGSQATDPLDGYHAFVLVRSFRARLGGQDYDRPVFGARFREKAGDWWFSVDAEKLELQPGDWLEAEVMLLPHAGPTPLLAKPTLERTRYGSDAPRLEEVTVGEKLSDFPARVRAADEVVAVKLAGGYDQLPLIAEGFRAPGVPLLWRDRVWQDQQVHGGDGYQVEGDGDGGYRFIFLCATRTKQTHDLLVTRVSHTAGIRSLRDENGRLAIEAAGPGRFHLRAPVPFGPGLNRVVAGAPTIAVEADGERLSELPLSIDVARGEALVDVRRWSPEGLELSVTGSPATLTCAGLQPGGSYRLELAGRTETRTAAGGQLRCEVAPGQTVTISPVR